MSDEAVIVTVDPQRSTPVVGSIVDLESSSSAKARRTRVAATAEPKPDPGEKVAASGSSDVGLEEFAKLREPEPEVKEAEEAKTPFQDEIERMTTEEADLILSQILQFEGRLPIKVKRRGEEKDEEFYCRLPTRRESQRAEERQKAKMHALRSGPHPIPALAEFVHQLEATLPPHQKAEIERIQADGSLSTTLKNFEILNVFAASPYFGLIQDTAEVLAMPEYHNSIAASCLEVRNEDGSFEPAYASADTFGDEEIDVANDLIFQMTQVHQKLQSARFLSLSSGEAPGATNGTSPKNTD